MTQSCGPVGGKSQHLIPLVVASSSVKVCSKQGISSMNLGMPGLGKSYGIRESMNYVYKNVALPTNESGVSGWTNNNGIICKRVG